MAMKTPLTAVVLTYNNQNTIQRCLNSLKFCDELIIIDSYSTDDTIKVAEQFGAKIYTRHLNHNWSAQRNFGLTKASHQWVLFVDSDEYVSPQLRREIVQRLKEPIVHGFYLRRFDKFLKKELHHGETANVRLLRLANKRYGRWTRPVHEVWSISQPVGDLRHPIIHDRNLTISSFIDRLNQYSSLDKFNFHPIDLLKPGVKFIVNYIFHAGFLDGYPGFAMAYLMSLNSLITRVKSWEK
jgi:glycosyltransferase involved in cell wall biosynthesis